MLFVGPGLLRTALALKMILVAVEVRNGILGVKVFSLTIELR